MSRKKEKKNREAPSIERRIQDTYGDEQPADPTPLVVIDNTDHWEQSCTNIEEAIRYLGETRERGNVTREILLADIQDRLKHSYCIEFLETQKDELIRILLLALDSESELELINSCGIINLLFAIFGVKWKVVFNKIEPLLKRNITNSLHYTVKAASLETLCWCLFLFNEQNDIKSSVEYLIDFFTEKSIIIVSKQSAVFFQQCLDMFCLLITQLDESFIVDEYLTSLEYIVSFLSSDYELNLRLAAGESLALLVSLVYAVESQNDREYSQNYFNGYFDVPDVVGLLQTTNEIHNRKISKKDREKQRDTFKDVLNTFQSGQSPTDQITVRGKKFTFSSWRDIKRLQSIRNVLGSGFLLHLELNPLISSQLSIQIIDTLKPEKQKHQRSGSSSAEEKDRTVKRNFGRDVKLKRIEGDQT